MSVFCGWQSAKRKRICLTANRTAGGAGRLIAGATGFAVRRDGKTSPAKGRGTGEAGGGVLSAFWRQIFARQGEPTWCAASAPGSPGLIEMKDGKSMAEEKREWLPASEWNDAVEKITAAQTRLDPKGGAWLNPMGRAWLNSMCREQLSPEEWYKHNYSTVQTTNQKAVQNDLDDPLSANEGFKQFQAWIKTATKPLLFPADRKRVKQELAEHYEERVESLTENGMSLDDAREKAVELLGSPEETGALLRRVHKPWLGWVLWLLRLVVAALLIVALVEPISESGNLRFWTKHRVLQKFNLADRTYENGTKHQITTIAERTWTAGEDIEFGPFTVSCEDVIYRYQREEWLSEYDDEREPEYRQEVHVLLRFTGAPWEKLSEDVSVVDSNGNFYTGGAVFGTSEYVSVWKQRVLPWAYVVDVNRNFWGEKTVNRLDILLGQGESAQKLSVWLGDWELRDVEALPGEEEINTASMVERLTDQCTEWKELGAAAPAAERKDAMELSILRAVLLPNAEMDQEPTEAEEGDFQTPDCGTVECILAVRGDMALQPFAADVLEQRLRIVDPAQGPDAPAIHCSIIKKEICRNVSFWEVCWDTVPGTKEYELQYWPTQEGAAGTLRLKLDFAQPTANMAFRRAVSEAGFPARDPELVLDLKVDGGISYKNDDITTKDCTLGLATEGDHVLVTRLYKEKLGWSASRLDSWPAAEGVYYTPLQDCWDGRWGGRLDIFRGMGLHGDKEPHDRRIPAFAVKATGANASLTLILEKHGDSDPAGQVGRFPLLLQETKEGWFIFRWDYLDIVSHGHMEEMNPSTHFKLDDEGYSLLYRWIIGYPVMDFMKIYRYHIDAYLELTTMDADGTILKEVTWKLP